MIFNFKTNEPDGLVLIDKQFFPEFSDALLYSFDIYLDVNGETELIYDFDEEWKTVTVRLCAVLMISWTKILCLRIGIIFKRKVHAV